MIAAALLAASSSSSSSSSLKSSSSTLTTTTTAMRKTTTEQQVRTLIPVTTSDGSKLFVSGPCIVLKTQPLSSAPPPATVAQQMQALRPLLKADVNNTTNTVDQDKEEKKHHNDRNNNNNNINASTNTTTISSSSVTAKKSAGSNSENEPEPLRCKRRIDFTSLGLPRPQPAAMARRNERERNRVKQVNMGFETLRKHVPQGRKNKKLSKVDTLKEAVKYINYLHQLLQEAADQDADDTSAITDTITLVSRSSPLTTTATAAAATTTTSPRPEPSSSSSSSSLPSMTSSTVTTSTNTTTSMSSDDFMNFTAVVDDSSTMDYSSSGSTTRIVSPDAADFHVNNGCELETEAVEYTPEELQQHLAQFTTVQDFNSVIQQHQQQQQQQQHQQQQQQQQHQQQQLQSIPSNIDVGGNTSPCQFLELTPAQVSFSHDLSTSPLTADHTGISIIPPGTDLAALHTAYYNNNAPVHPSAALTFMNFASSSSSTTGSSPDSPPPPPPLADVPHKRFLHHPDDPQTRFQAGQKCRGSEGSCPVSPCQSSGGASESPGGGDECLGVSECETWQDLSADIAEWLCSKIDIDDPEVFV